MKKPLQVLDIEHLNIQTSQDRALQCELLTLFEDQAAEIMRCLADPLASPEQRAAVVHRLKGSARAIGAFRVAEAAEAVETDLRGGSANSPSLESLRETVDRDLTIIHQRIAALTGA